MARFLRSFPARELELELEPAGGFTVLDREPAMPQVAHEREQTVDLLTYNLSLTNFSPDWDIAQEPIKAARKAVLNYFGRGS